MVSGAVSDVGANESPLTGVVYKDLYLRHPAPTLQCEKYCWGNLEKAHVVLGVRTQDEVSKYRCERGIIVEALRGRSPPKPFQSFQETSFPEFVTKLAYELFTTSAEPFPVQAQAWPCALSGMDLLAVAPTGSGKTLAYLLPALVHIMAQEELKKGEGPIALILVPTRELAQQTLAVSERFVGRTSGADLLRTRAIYGGVDMSLQLPLETAPDLGRWPELLVATPGRLIGLVQLNHLTLRRSSYVVLDEADILVSPGPWLSQLRRVIDLCHPDRQLFVCSATMPPQAEAQALELCGGGDIVRLRVEPRVPSIPQEVRLCPGDRGPDDKGALIVRRKALMVWLTQSVQRDEAVLIFCAKPGTAIDLAKELRESNALGGGDVGCAAGHEDPTGKKPSDTYDVYRRFAEGHTRILVTTFNHGARGLDYADTTAAAADVVPFSLVVVIFDFPRSIVEYIHCIGRTMRPGQKPGRVLTFLPELRYWVVDELIDVIKRCRQEPSQELQDLSSKNATFLRECKAALRRVKKGAPPWDDGCDSGGLSWLDASGEGGYDSEKGVWTLPPNLPSYLRRLLHALADEESLPHVSTGVDPLRSIHIAAKREHLPSSFFWEGEAVVVSRKGEVRRQARISDSRIHPQYRSVKVVFDDFQVANVQIDHLSLVTKS